jgi:hypothetical protein
VRRREEQNEKILFETREKSQNGLHKYLNWIDKNKVINTFNRLINSQTESNRLKNA